MNETVVNWLSRDPDLKTRTELQSLIDAGDDAELEKRFAGRLEFGTAGLRGEVGAGPSRMNRLVIQETSAGLAQYLLDTLPCSASRGVLVAYDGRLDSKRFAHDAATVFAAMGVTTYLTQDVAATPLAAFGVLSLGCAAGVVVTASHNPPQYNGFKVYWENGAQIIPPHDVGIAEAIGKAANNPIPWEEFETACDSGKIVFLGADFYRSYTDAILQNPLFTSVSPKRAISIAYTAMHGVGADVAETLLAESGFAEVHSVASQREPDGAFPTVNFPNPEEPGAMDAVLELARKYNTSIACANDPDADRLAAAVRTPDGGYQMLTGDQMGVLLANFLLEKEHDFVPIVCTTIVSSSMLQHMAESAGAHFHETLTGFKWLANIAMDHEDENGNHQFLFAYEEALGYALGSQVRDKDGLSALLAFAQMADALAQEDKTVLDQLESLYRRHGIFLTAQRSIATEPGGGSLGDSLRAQPPESIAGSDIVSVDDLSVGLRTYSDGSTQVLSLPPSDVLIYRLENAARIIVRPSGTEPKVKCYYEVVATVGDQAFDAVIENTRRQLDELIEQHQLSCKMGSAR